MQAPPHLQMRPQLRGRHPREFSHAIPRMVDVAWAGQALSNVSQLRDRVAGIPGIDEVRRELLSSASKRTVVMSQHLLSEMAGYESSKRRPYFEADMALLNSLPFLKVLKAQRDLSRLEIQRAMTGREFDPFINAHCPIDYNDPEYKRLFEGERRWVKGRRTSGINTSTTQRRESTKVIRTSMNANES